MQDNLKIDIFKLFCRKQVQQEQCIMNQTKFKLFEEFTRLISDLWSNLFYIFAIVVER